jgi:voltage-gated potassium channel
LKWYWFGGRYAGLIFGGLFLVAVHAVGTLGYLWIGRPNATWIDSFYMTFITVATIGYGEVIDLTHHPYGRLFTVFIAVLGIGAMSYLFSSAVALVVTSNLSVMLKRKRMEKAIEAMTGHFIVCGVGRVGANVALELLATKRQLVIIESDQQALNHWLENHPGTPHLHEDAADDDALTRAGVMQCAGVFAVTGDDSHNLMVSLSVKLLNPKARVVARLHDIRNAAKAKKAGADEIVSPDFTGGMRIASAMVRPHVVNFMDQMLRTDEALRVEEVALPAHFAPSTVAAAVPKDRNYILVAIHEAGQWIFNPTDDQPLRPGMALVLMSNPLGRQTLERYLRSSA